MADWKECKLGNCIELIGGGTPKTSIPEYWNGEIPWLSVVDFNTGKKYVDQTEKSITELGFKNSSTKVLNPNDIIISARGTVGVIAVLKKNMAFNQSCYGVRNIQEITEQKFLYYLLKDSIDGFKQIAHGGVFDTITRGTFDSIDILLPPLPEQRAIASVLSSLDDKIDLLHRQNKTLEAMAETLFRQWFIEAAPQPSPQPSPRGRGGEEEEADEGWGEVPLSTFADNIRENVKVEDLSNHAYYVGLEHIPRKRVILDSWGETGSIESNKSIFKKYDILFGKLRDTLLPKLMSGELRVSQ